MRCYSSICYSQLVLLKEEVMNRNTEKGQSAFYLSLIEGESSRNEYTADKSSSVFSYKNTIGQTFIDEIVPKSRLRVVLLTAEWIYIYQALYDQQKLEMTIISTRPNNKSKSKFQNCKHLYCYIYLENTKIFNFNWSLLQPNFVVISNICCKRTERLYS